MARTAKTEQVTSLEQLKQYADGNIVRLPDFAEGQPFVAKLKRPSILGMAKQGKIPNSLLVKTNELFVQSGSLDTEENSMMQEIYDVIDLIASETFVEPTYDEIKSTGIELTDEQMMFIFNYSQQGVKALESFRTE
jgi:hypothetical protein|nr:MAG TPA: hypothetical protein [Caudoviricetes sp.]DAW18950.1 MAG TPA: hypothetical protein [Caudoviricetes sp.]